MAERWRCPPALLPPAASRARPALGAPRVACRAAAGGRSERGGRGGGGDASRQRNAAITACGRQLRWAEALDLFQRMAVDGVPRTEVSFGAVLGALARAGRWREAVALASSARGDGSVLNAMAYSSAVSACAKASAADVAVELLHAAVADGVQLDSALFNAAIDGCARGSRWAQVLSLLQEMRDLRVPTSVGTYRLAVSACERAERWEVAVGLVSELCAGPLPLDLHVMTSAISACGKRQQWAEVLCLFREFERCGDEPDAVVCETTLAAMDRAGRGPEALAILDGLLRRGLTPSRAMVGSSVAACVGAGDVDGARSLLARAEDLWDGGSTLAYNALLTESSRSHAAQQALDLVEHMRQRGVPCSTMTYGLVLTACGRSLDWPSSLSLLSRLGPAARDGLPERSACTGEAPIDAVTHATVALACARSAAWRHALALIAPESLGRWGLAEIASPMSFSEAMVACARVGLWEHAVAVLQCMRDLGRPPGATAYNAAISACSKFGAWEAVLALGASLSEEAQPNRDSLALLVRACERAGRWQLAMHLFSDLSASSVEAGTVGYNAAIYAAGLGRCWSAAVALLKDMSAHRVPMSRATLNGLMRACTSPVRPVEATAGLVLLQAGLDAAMMPGWAEQGLSAKAELQLRDLQYAATKLELQVAAAGLNNDEARLDAATLAVPAATAASKVLADCRDGAPR